MTDRIHSLTVVLEKDFLSDDLEPIVKAIKMIKGVLSASHHVSNIESHMAEERARQELGEKLWKVLYPSR